jgi:uncharacterized Zn-binding protein involved in type VI secretion
MTLPAARHADPAVCSHGSTPLDGSTTVQVKINGRNAVKVGSLAGCAATGSTIVSGSGSVLINGAPASRATDRTTDGIILVGSFDVLIGGPTVGMAGAIGAQTDACQAAAATRKSGSTRQSYGNCGLESWRNAINAQRAATGLPPLTEDELLEQQQAKGRAGKTQPGHYAHGTTNAAGRVQILNDHGIPAETAPQSVNAIEEAVREGKGVSVSVHPHWWGDYVKPDPSEPGSWLHEVAVTGVEYDEHGHVKAFIINDTGLGACGYRLTVEQMEQCLEKRVHMTVTKSKVW